MLQRFGGRLVDVRVTYRASLVTPASVAAARGSAASPPPWKISEHRRRTVGPNLRRLARESGRFSRFRTDARIAPGVFESIYDAWIRRSVHHEIADNVLVAKIRTRILGLVTVKASADRGEIGLLSVDATARGRGIGRALVAAAHASMVGRGCSHAVVATQRANRQACALYESTGYAVQRIERVYHLWL